MAILLPSANNVAVLVARQVDGSASGYDPGTISTALDQLRLAQLVAKDSTLAAVMTRSYSLPVAGDVANTDNLLGQDGFAGMKTGSDAAAGGCRSDRQLRQPHDEHARRPSLARTRQATNEDSGPTGSGF
jgi:serine-type D-Ala-D-Ala carboxypeptidase (penicillin-binding protein 5/6)